MMRFTKGMWTWSGGEEGLWQEEAVGAIRGDLRIYGPRQREADGEERRDAGGRDVRMWMGEVGEL